MDAKFTLFYSFRLKQKIESKKRSRQVEIAIKLISSIDIFGLNFCPLDAIKNLATMISKANQLITKNLDKLTCEINLHPFLDFASKFRFTIEQKLDI
ncbi:hypothetical protein BpHYR1_033962 [Brachionus plicatilis]|uniref:Uncharacterized protein n=1 Tax=Brachionus plicatilis TaxID=10195 RepID=A0A3M7QLC9_BRAPC|nr:hypothetical protein BpHYR1_033962 [Brachionus plicatilis]